MLGILLIYFIGKWFYSLAEAHGRNKWGFAILGVGVYFGAQILFGIVLGFLAIAFDWEWVFATNGILTNILGIAAGALAAWGVRAIFKYNWSKNLKDNTSDTLLDGI
ncbi:MAG: hypothetical protein P8M19_04150 [Crocinitomicaceae bacterium]|nr:hypothetical protein [Crocinitomicaceae bacterium]MDG1659184.1 hypothetical protein [Crocinitomicaceae bacterium]MDG2440842.1 hypothetical protein [Crocinitomicaceae bacterium]|tara:strand:- start:7274 stop:7594 length:321 start_codon:yes stop_codon:yes gene_type:complete